MPMGLKGAIDFGYHAGWKSFERFMAFSFETRFNDRAPNDGETENRTQEDRTMTKKVVVMNEAGVPTGVIRFEFDDKTTQEIDVNSLSEATKFRALVHGISQKVGDSYAGAKAEENPLAFAKQAAADTIAQILAGDWKAAREGGPRVTDLATAFKSVSDAQGQPITIEEAVAFLGTLDEEQTKAFRKKPKIASALAQIALAKAAKKAEELAKKAAEAAE